MFDTPRRNPCGVYAVLHDFLAPIQLSLGGCFQGMYLDDCVALGDIDPRSSDMDCVVMTHVPLSNAFVEALHNLHARFDALARRVLRRARRCASRKRASGPTPRTPIDCRPLSAALSYPSQSPPGLLHPRGRSPQPVRTKILGPLGCAHQEAPNAEEIRATLFVILHTLNYGRQMEGPPSMSA